MTQQPAAGEWIETNRAWWDERAPLHAQSKSYDLAGFLAGRDTLRPYEPVEVGDVKGKTLLHLMCHIGLDTLSWARRGAQVTGLDFSDSALEIAADTAARTGVDAEFIVADVYKSAEALAPRTFDIVYTGTGVLQWLPDIDAWARNVAALVAPGGIFYLADFHPFGDIIDDEVKSLRRSYFDRGPFVEQQPGSYADQRAQTTANTSAMWTHHIGSIVNALATAGLRLEFLHEYDFTDAPSFYGLEQDEDGFWRFPEGRWQIPLMFSLRASKDA